MRRRLPVAAAAAALTVVACGDDDGETLTPLPVEGGTAVPPVSPSPPGSPAAGRAPAGSPAPDASAPESTAPPTAGGPPPVADWDGARYDVGTILTVSELDGHVAIGFDRYSYADPERGTIDAPSFEEEPVEAWWRANPYTNVRVQGRTFVLDRDVEVLVLAEAQRVRACAEPPPSPPPEPLWEQADLDRLDDPTVVGELATLTYSSTGQVTRIRFTRGC